jgi:hypothetical protein
LDSNIYEPYLAASITASSTIGLVAVGWVAGADQGGLDGQDSKNDNETIHVDALMIN